MLNKKELIVIIISTLVLAFSITLLNTWKNFAYALAAVFILLMANIIAKKIAAFYFDAEVEIKLWEFRRFGFRKHWYVKRPFPAGAVFPIVSKIILFPINSFVWMASLVFDVKAKVYRARKRHELYSFSEMTEDHIGYIAAAGIFLNLLLAFIFYFIGGDFGVLFAKLNIFYAFFNMIPLSDLDGNKIFFGNIVLWSFFAVLSLIGIGYVFLVP